MESSEHKFNAEYDKIQDVVDLINILIEEELSENCKPVFNNLFFKDSIPYKEITKARKAFAPMSEGEHPLILLTYDKKSNLKYFELLITDQAVYIKFKYYESSFDDYFIDKINWIDIEYIDIKKSTGTSLDKFYEIWINNSMFFYGYFGSKSGDFLLRLFLKLMKIRKNNSLLDSKISNSERIHIVDISDLESVLSESSKMSIVLFTLSNVPDSNYFNFENLVRYLGFSSRYKNHFQIIKCILDYTNPNTIVDLKKIEIIHSTIINIYYGKTVLFALDYCDSIYGQLFHDSKAILKKLQKYLSETDTLKLNEDFLNKKRSSNRFHYKMSSIRVLFEQKILLPFSIIFLMALIMVFTKTCK